MEIKLESTAYFDFITSASTGAAADADSLPTVEVFEDATDSTLTGATVTKRTSKTGNYRVAIVATAANGYETGKSYNVVASATVGGVAAKAIVKTFQVRARSVDDVLPTASYTTPPTAVVNATAVRTELATELARVDQNVSAAKTLANGSITAAVIATDAIDADALAASAITEVQTGIVASVDTAAVAAAVWAAATRTLTSSGALTDAQAGYLLSISNRLQAENTLTVQTSVTGGTQIDIVRGDAFSVSITDLGPLTVGQKVWLTVKTSVADTDAQSILQIQRTAGLVYLNAAAPVAPVVAGDGVVTVTNATTGAITITLAARATAGLVPTTGQLLRYDVQILDSAGVPQTMRAGRVNVKPDITRAIA